MIPFLFLANTFFSGYFVSAIRGMTFLPTFCHFTGQISYPFDFISWHNLLVEFYGNSRPVDIILRQAQSQSSRFLVRILHQTHFLQDPLVHNITLHTLRGLSTWWLPQYLINFCHHQKQVHQDYYLNVNTFY